MVRHGMGSTEAMGGFANFFPLGVIPPRGVVPLGNPGPSTKLVATPEMGPDVFEVFIGGPVASGYLGDPERTSQRFVEIDGTPVWRSGDLVRLREDNQYVHAGRSDDLVKVRGMLASPSETTARLLELDGVRAALTLPYVSAHNTRLVSFVELSPVTDKHSTGIRNAVAEKLPPHLVPHDVIIYETLPSNTRGKFDRQALLDAYRASIEEDGQS